MAGSFTDTNVLVYLASADLDKATRAEEVVAGGGTISVQVLNELTDVARRKMLMSWDETNELLATLRRLVAVVPITVATHERGLHVAERFGIAVYDAMSVAAAAIAGSDVLWTEDLQDGAIIEGVRVSNPFLPASLSPARPPSRRAAVQQCSKKSVATPREAEAERRDLLSQDAQGVRLRHRGGPRPGTRRRDAPRTLCGSGVVRRPDLHDSPENPAPPRAGSCLLAAKSAARSAMPPGCEGGAASAGSSLGRCYS